MATSPLPERVEHFQRTRGFSVSLQVLDLMRLLPHQALDALAEIEAWARQEDSPPVFVLVGESGVGKTTTLKHLTRDLLERGKAGENLPRPVYVDVPDVEVALRLVREEGALVLFDGLDRGRELVRTLWAALPDAARPAEALQPGKHRGKLLISGRPQDFHDLGEGVDLDRFPAFCLEPFSEEQIRDYLASLLKDGDRARATFDSIAAIHGLLDLARRPFLLKLVAEQLSGLEDLEARGEKVKVVRLYDRLVRAWIDRSGGKQQVERPPKQPTIEKCAYSPLQEYLRASQLARALDEGRVEELSLAATSDEALDFLGQIIGLGQHAQALRTMERMLGEDRLDAALLAFRYWLRAMKGSWPTPSPARVNLAGADLEGWTIRGLEGRPLSLRGANLSAARLNRALVEHVDLSEANLDGLEARQALFFQVSIPRATARAADLTGLRWWHGSLLDADLGDAELSGCHWSGVDVSGARLPEGWERRAWSFSAGAQQPIPRAAGSAQPIVLGGHAGWVHACAWSPGGDRLLSGSSDQTLKVWDAVSGRCLLILEGHTGAVQACAWSPGGDRLLSGSRDGTLKIWDAASGRCLLTLEGHASSVHACAWNPSGDRVLSGSSDRTLKVWDSGSGRCLQTLEGHASSVQACAWNPSGDRLLSGSSNGTLKIWDAVSGRCLVTLEGSVGDVHACAWSPSGDRIVSGSGYRDQTLKVWDAASGRCLHTLEGHSGTVQACAWSPRGDRLLSAYDRLRRRPGSDPIAAVVVIHSRLRAGAVEWVGEWRS